MSALHASSSHPYLWLNCLAEGHNRNTNSQTVGYPSFYPRVGYDIVQECFQVSVERPSIPPSTSAIFSSFIFLVIGVGNLSRISM